MSIKIALKNNIKNIIGWKTKRKIIVFSVDDYGNVRVDSKKARENMDKAGLKVLSRFDAFDALETREDLEMLYSALTSVKDKYGRPCIFTPFAMPVNINFEKMAENNYSKYEYELLPQTFSKLGSIYEGTWKLWEEGIKNKLLKPQFHGREHFNLKIFEEALERRDRETLTALKNRSYTSISKSGYPTISVTAAFEFWNFEENKFFNKIIKDGLNQFKTVFGYCSTHFNPPGGREHPYIHKALQGAGIKYLDTPWLKQEHQGNGKYKRKLNYTGKKNHLDQTFIVRNCVFEPTESSNIDWVNYCLNQVDAAFCWNRPAVISSHRINFCGHMDEKNRKTGILALRSLLNKIVTRWPDVEFMAAHQLGDLIVSNE